MNLTKLLMLTLISAVAFTGCSKDEDEAPAPTPTPTPTPAPTYPISGSAAFTCVLEDAGSVTYVAGTDGFSNTSGNVTGGGSASYNSALRNTTTSITGADIYFYGLDYTGAAPTDQQFYDYFAEGSKPFATLTSTDPTGVSVTFRSGSGSWTTLQMPQSTSNFTITDSEPVDDGSGIAKVKIRATFNCRVNPVSSIDMRDVTGGIFVGVFAKSN
ncbi:MAG: hypothetical protein JNN32_04770 [Flavobacteriales bacterium]|nr:hypothetical protein [Flavobacteriales bacterium]